LTNQDKLDLAKRPDFVFYQFGCFLSLITLKLLLPLEEEYGAGLYDQGKVYNFRFVLKRKFTFPDYFPFLSFSCKTLKSLESGVILRI